MIERISLNNATPGLERLHQAVPTAIR
jgi:hypothetical protein